MFTSLASRIHGKAGTKDPISCFRITDTDYTHKKPALKKSYQINLTFSS